MDPASILSLVSASLTITMRAATIGKDLYSLKSKFQSADKKVHQLSIHVSAMRVAARSLSWLEDDAVGSEEVEEIKGELFEVLSACCELLSDLQDHVSSALAGAENVEFKGALSYIWNEDIIKETTQTLHQQEVALLLILQTLRQTKKSEQLAKLNEPINAEILMKAKRPSSSIFGLNGDQHSSLRYSVVTENSDKLDITFSFDTEVMASTAYRNFFTDLLRHNLSRERNPNKPSHSDKLSIVTIKSEAPTLESDKKPSSLRDACIIAIDDDESPHLQQLAEIPQGHLKSFTDKSQSVMYVQALYDWEADDHTCLSFREGDLIYVLTQIDSGWWDGVLHDIRGWFPINYCKVVTRLVGPGRAPKDDIDSEDSRERERKWRVRESERERRLVTWDSVNRGGL